MQIWKKYALCPVLLFFFYLTLYFGDLSRFFCPFFSCIVKKLKSKVHWMDGPVPTVRQWGSPGWMGQSWLIDTGVLPSLANINNVARNTFMRFINANPLCPLFPSWYFKPFRRAWSSNSSPMLTSHLRLNPLSWLWPPPPNWILPQSLSNSLCFWLSPTTTFCSFNKVFYFLLKQNISNENQ